MKHKAYFERLGITPQQQASLPQITPDLRILMEEKKEKGLPHDPWYYLQACPDGGVRKMLALREQNHPAVPLEAYCAALELDPIHILNCIISTADRLENYVAGGRMSNAKRDVAKALIDGALLPGDLGTADRRLFMQATGMLPQPKGAQTLIQVTQNATTNAPTAVVMAPPPEKTIRTLSDRLNKLMLPPPAEPEDAEYEE